MTIDLGGADGITSATGHRADPCAIRCTRCPNRRLGWFCSLGSGALEDLERVSDPVFLPAHASLFDQETAPSSLFVVCSGYVKLTVRREHDRQMVAHVGGPGSILGLHAALSDCKHEVSACSLTPLHLRSIKRDSFFVVLRRNKEIQKRALQSLCRQYRFALEHSCRTALSETVAERLGRLLIEMANQLGDPLIGRGIRLPFLLTHEEIATMIGSTRETVTRTLVQFRKRGWISIESSVLVLKNPEMVRTLL